MPRRSGIRSPKSHSDFKSGNRNGNHAPKSSTSSESGQSIGKKMMDGLVNIGVVGEKMMDGLVTIGVVGRLTGPAHSPFNKCEFLHKAYQECVSEKGGAELLCIIYGEKLVNECNAVRDGSSLQYSKNQQQK